MLPAGKSSGILESSAHAMRDFSKQAGTPMGFSVRATSEGRTWSGLEAFTCDSFGGTVERPPSTTYRVAMHLSRPITATCAIGGPPVRSVIGPGSLDIIPLGYPASWTDEGPARVVSANMSPTLVRSAAAEIGMNPDRVSIVPRVHVTDPVLEHLSWALAAELEDCDRHDAFFAESLANAMALHLLRRYSIARSVRLQQRLSRKQLDAVVDYITENLASNLSLSQLAAVAGVSPSYFTVLFKRTAGVSVHQYVMRCRVDHAMRLLARGDARLAQVAQDAGFTDQSHMARCMRRLVGTTPAAFSREFRERV